MHLVPPMDSEPPRDYVEFVAVSLTALQGEAARLVGGDLHADEVYPEALSDVAGRWRRLRLMRRLGRRDASAEFLRHRLAVRAKQWRDDQIYEVDVRPVPPPGRLRAPAPDTVARRLAPLIPTTVRTQARPVAEAAIAWSHAYRRARWRLLGRQAAAVVLVFGALLQMVRALPSP
jgi:hypothetical protein